MAYNKEKRKALKEKGLCIECGESKATRGQLCNMCYKFKTVRNMNCIGNCPAKSDCYWFNPHKRNCGVLTSLVCTQKGKCSFYETPAEFKERNIKYNNEIGYQLNVLKETAKAEKWSRHKLKSIRGQLLTMPANERKEYFNKVVGVKK